MSRSRDRKCCCCLFLLMLVYSVDREQMLRSAVFFFFSNGPSNPYWTVDSLVCLSRIGGRPVYAVVDFFSHYFYLVTSNESLPTANFDCQTTKTFTTKKKRERQRQRGNLKIE